MTIERFHEGPRMSQAVTYNGIAYPSGQTAGDAADDVQSQTRAVLKKIGDRANKAISLYACRDVTIQQLH